MNYLRIYNEIINNAKNTIRNCYVEKHHIIPRCMGGTDAVGNIVKLTAREHYICHWLLAKTYNTKKLWGAFAMLCVASNKHQRLTNSRMFEKARIARSMASSGNGNGMYGKASACKSHTPETKEKIRLAKLGKPRIQTVKRPPASQETKDKISKSKMGVPSRRKGIKANLIKCPHCHKIIGGEGNFNRYHGDKCKKKEKLCH
jgi:NUMOD3 motif